MSHPPPIRRSMRISPVYDVPMAMKPDMSHIPGFHPHQPKPENKALVEDFSRCIVGPMPPDAFLRDFLPPRLEGRATPSRPSTTSAYVPESDIFATMISALNDGLCPGFVFKSTTRPGESHPQWKHAKPHICCYAADTFDAVLQAPPSECRELGYAEFFIDFQACDFFADPPSDTSDADRLRQDFIAGKSDEIMYELRDRVWGQHIAYAIEVFARQYRTHMFSISVCGPRARFFRWDRGGCIVSESFDVRDEKSDYMCDFLWRYSQMNDIQRGHDLTVEEASPDDEVRFRGAIAEHVRLQLGLEGADLEEAVSEHYVPGHVAVMQVLSQDATTSADNIRRFLVSRPVVSPVYLDGRGTRGFWALDLLTFRVVFIKDTWRCYLAEHEGDVVRQLNLNGVKNVPSLVCHGDVPDFFPEEACTMTEEEMQMSLTDEYTVDNWVTPVHGKKPDIDKQLHYRLVLGTVGYGLKHFRGTKELLHATYDVFHAMRDAHTKAARLHRDISLNNIILVQEPGEDVRRGYLIDWDASAPVDESGGVSVTGHTGIWQFMSIDMLDLPHDDWKHTLQDDMESLFYVVLYCCVLWLPHKGSKNDISIIFSNFFDSTEYLDDRFIGGLGKIANAANRKYTSRFRFKSTALRRWLETVMDYHSPPNARFEELKDKWSDPDHLDNFWGDFLRTHNLPCDDSVVHDHPQSNGIHLIELTSSCSESDSSDECTSDSEGSRVSHGKSPKKRARTLQASSAREISSVLLHRHRVPVSDSPNDERRRRMREHSEDDSHASADPGASVELPPSRKRPRMASEAASDLPLRRSKRIRDKRYGVQGNSG